MLTPSKGTFKGGQVNVTDGCGNCGNREIDDLKQPLRLFHARTLVPLGETEAYCPMEPFREVSRFEACDPSS